MQEAMASGVVVCGTNVGILADLGEQFGVIAPPKDDSGLASRILNLIEDEARYLRITQNAYQWITQENGAWASENYRLFIDSLLVKRSFSPAKQKTL